MTERAQVGDDVLARIEAILTGTLELERHEGRPHCFRLGSADVHLSAGDGLGGGLGPAAVGAVAQATSILVREVPLDSDLLSVLNELNTRARFLRVYYSDGCVYAAADILSAVVADPVALTTVCSYLSDFADSYDGKLRRRFGGRRAEDAEGCHLCDRESTT